MAKSILTLKGNIYYGKKGEDGNGLFVFTTVELPGSGLYNEGLVSFSMSHCSEYIVTDVNHGEVYKKEESNPIGKLHGD